MIETIQKSKPEATHVFWVTGFYEQSVFLFHTVHTADGRNPAPGNGIFSISTGAASRISSIKKTTIFSLKNHNLEEFPTQPTQIHHLSKPGFDGFLKKIKVL